MYWCSRSRAGACPWRYEIARDLGAPLDVFVVRKLGVPWQPELAMGAIAGRGTEVLNGDVVTAYNIPPHVIRAVAEREGRELSRRLHEYRGDRPFPDPAGTNDHSRRRRARHRVEHARGGERRSARTPARNRRGGPGGRTSHVPRAES